MSIFDDTRTEFSQQHFTIVEIDLPVVEGECTISGAGGFGTSYNGGTGGSGIVIV